MTGNSFGFTAPAHDQCVPLPLAGDVDAEVGVFLSLYAVDLLTGERAAQPLRELAASVRWTIT